MLESTRKSSQTTSFRPRNSRLRLSALILFILCATLAFADEGPAPQQPPTPNQPAPAEAKPNADAEGNDEEQPQDPRDKRVAISFRDADIQQIAQFLMNELGKPVIIHDSIKSNKITILSKEEVPLITAFELIGNALRQKGVMIVEGPKQIELLPLSEARRVNRPVIATDESVADVEDQSKIVDKVFVVEHYDVMKLKDMVVPMLPDYAFLVADPNTRRLVVTAAAADLTFIEKLVARLDVPRENEALDQRVFPLTHANAGEVAAMIRTILDATSAGNAPVRGGGPNQPRNNNLPGGGKPGENKPGANAVLFEDNGPTVLVQADASRNWIIAAAPPAIMTQIERWVHEFDQPKKHSEYYDLYNVQHADIEELASQINAAIEGMPKRAPDDQIRVIPFTKSGQLLVYGSEQGRSIVESLLKQLDVPSSQHQVIKEIQLQYDSAENVKKKIEELFSQQDQNQGRSRFFYYGRRGRDEPEQPLTVTADTQRNTITIMTDPARLARIEELVSEQWDQPIDFEEVKPKVYTLKHTDPVQMQTLLENMFTKSSSRTSFSWWSDTISTESNNPVGRLFGQFSFQAMRDSNKLIVSTKSSENYKVIDALIEEIDQPQDAGLPVIIELKHANAEEVAEQLNAMFAEPGTSSFVTRMSRGLSESVRTSSVAETDNRTSQNNQNQNRGNNQQASANEMAFWWSQSRPNTTEQPTSNLIGKPRFVPVNRRNALMLLVPRAHVEPFRELIANLDQPGSQVVIHAIITEIQHDDESTLGIRIASDPSILNDSRLADQSIGGDVSATYTNMFANGDGVLNVGVDLNVLLQLLIKKLNLKILNEPRVYTADNQEAHFFDGQDVPVITSDQSSRETSDTFNRSFDYRSVGTRLHVRPHITQDGEVDLEVNLELSRIVTGSSVFGNFIFDRRETTTHVTVRDGQTIVVSGIVRQEDFDEVRKLPLLGDIPLIAPLFRSTDRGVRNREVIAFVTPHVIATNGNEAEEISDSNREWLKRIRGAIDKRSAADEEESLYSTPDQRSRLVPPTTAPEQLEEPAPEPESDGKTSSE